MGTNLTAALPAPDMSSVGLAIAEHSPLPLATVEGASHIVRYVNPAFCLLLDKPKDELIGIPVSEMMHDRDEFLSLLDQLYQTKKSASHSKQHHSLPHSVFWSYTMWPVLTDENPLGVMIQVTETAHSHEHMIAINEALMLGSLRQHELTETAENLNAQLEAEIIERKQAEEALSANDRRLRFAKRLRQQTHLGNVVLVAMTGYGEASARQLSREAGFDHHLVKPADFKKLYDILAGVAADRS